MRRSQVSDLVTTQDALDTLEQIEEDKGQTVQEFVVSEAMFLKLRNIGMPRTEVLVFNGRYIRSIFGNARREFDAIN